MTACPYCDYTLCSWDVEHPGDEDIVRYKDEVENAWFLRSLDTRLTVAELDRQIDECYYARAKRA